MQHSELCLFGFVEGLDLFNVVFVHQFEAGGVLEELEDHVERQINNVFNLDNRATIYFLFQDQERFLVLDFPVGAGL